MLSKRRKIKKIYIYILFFCTDETLTAAAASTEKERAMREQYAELAANNAALQTQVEFSVD